MKIFLVFIIKCDDGSTEIYHKSIDHILPIGCMVDELGTIEKVYFDIDTNTVKCYMEEYDERNDYWKTKYFEMYDITKIN